MPMVPAALLLDEVAHRLSQETGLDINTAKHIRLSAPLEPGQQLDVQYQQKSPAEYRFIGTEKGSPVVKGVLNYTVTEPKYVPPTTFDSAAIASDSKASLEIPEELSDVYERLPHSGSMRLLQQVLTWEPQRIACLATPQQPHPLGRDGWLSCWAALEYAAQALACHGILSLRHENGNDATRGFRKAMLIGIREMICYRTQPGIRPLQPCQVEVTLLAQQPQAASCSFLLRQDDQVLSSGQFNTLYESVI